MNRVEEELGRGPSVPAPGVVDAVRRFHARAEEAGLVDVAWATINSPVGALTVAGTERGLVRLSFGSVDDTLAQLADRVSPRVLEAPWRLDPVRRQVEEYFEGRRREFDLPLDWRLSSGFRRQVLNRLVEVHYGEVVTYAVLAERAGSPRASRAVGTTMATNPIPIVLPCHRVVRADGSLGGYSGGLDTKRFLLQLEGVPVPE